jgi:hypothetical protein
MGQFYFVTEHGVSFPAYDTATRDALPAADKPKGITFYNTDTDRLETNKGTGAAPIWDGAGGSGVQATESLAGIAEIATQAETHAGVDDLRFITPLKLESEKGIADGLASLDATGKVPSGQLSGGGKSMILSFAAGTDIGLETSTIGYVLKAKFKYAGSAVVGDILSINVNAWKNSAGGATGEIRIVDATNADAVIAELTGITSIDEDGNLDLGTISNLPVGSATFELQMGRSAGAARTLFCSSIELVY